MKMGSMESRYILPY